MEPLDIGVVAIVAISGLFAFIRGFTREALSIVAWVGAAVVAFYGVPTVQPIMRSYFSASWLLLADILTYLVPFLVALVVFSIIVGIISAQIRNIGLGALDRALGLMFGVARGALLVCLAYLVLSHQLKTEDTPGWITAARSRPLLAAGAAEIQDLLPTRAHLEKILPGAFPAASHAADKAADILNSGQAAEKLQDALDKVTGQPEPKPAQKPTDPKNPEANSDNKGLDQLFQTQGQK